MKHEHDKVRSRNESFNDKVTTKIWDEQPSENNPYLAKSVRCHGYDLFELAEKRCFADVLYLLFRGELPSQQERKLFETLMIGLINPGPRHPATRAAMNTGVGKTDTLHILPISMMVLGGSSCDAGVIEPAIRFLRKQRRSDPAVVASELLQQLSPQAPEEELSLAPGFGSLYGEVDPCSQKLVETLLKLPSAGQSLQWGNLFAQQIAPQNQGWLKAGVAAAVFSDLGFHPRVGGGLFQLLCAPGLFAHGVELANKPITAMPFVKDENYVIETE